MLGGVSTVAQSIASIYNSNNAALAETLGRIASGKKINKASDDFSGYVRANNMTQDIEGYARVKENLTEAKAVADVAAEAGNSIYEDISRMKELAQLYIDNTGSDDRAAYTAEFNALKSSINNIIANANYDGTQLVAAGTATSVATDPDANGSFDVYFVAGDILSVAALSISNGTAAVQTQVNTATTYLVKAESFSDQATRQLNMAETIIQSKRSVVSMITDIDEAEETTKSINLSIRQQASIAMLAQANMSQSAIMGLYS